MNPNSQAPDPDRETDDLDADELFARLKGWFKTDLAALDDWRKEAKEDFDFYAGEHWSEDDKEKLKQELRPIITFNRTQLVVDSVSGSEVNNRQEVKYYPRENGDSKVAELYTAAGAYFRDQTHADDEDSDAFFDTVICGVGATETRLDFTDNPEGDPVVERVDPLEMVWDSGARKANLLDGRRFFRVKDMSLDEAKEMFPDAEPHLLDAPWARDEEDTDGRIKDNRPGDAYNGTEQAGLPRERVTIVHAQWKEQRDYMRVTDPATGQTKDVDEAEFAQMQERAAMMGIAIEGKPIQKSVWRQAFIGGELLTEADDTLCKKCSWKFITGKRDRNKGVWFGIVRAMKDPQRWANKWLSQSLHILNSNAKGGVMVEEGAVTDRRQFEESFAKPNAISWVPNGTLANGRIQPKPQAPMPAGFMQLLEFAVSSVRDVSGINLEMLGMADRDQPGVLEFQRRQSAMTVIARLFDSLRRYRKHQGELMLSLIKDYLSDGRLVRVVGDEGAQYVPLMRADGVEEFDVVVDEAPSSPNQKEVSWQIIMQMLPVIADKMTPELWAEVLTYSPLPTSLVEKVKGTIAQMAENPPPNPEMIKAEMESKKLQMQSELEMQKVQMQAELKVRESEQSAALETSKMQRMSEVERMQAMADMEVERQKAALEMELAEKKFELERQLKLMDYQMKTEQHRQTLELKQMDTVSRADGDVAQSGGAGGGRSQSSDNTPMLAAAMTALARSLESSNRPKRVKRDKNGDIVGIEVVE